MSENNDGVFAGNGVDGAYSVAAVEHYAVAGFYRFVGMFGARLAVGFLLLGFVEQRVSVGLPGCDCLAFFLELAAGFFSGLFVGLRAADVADSSLDGGIGAFENPLGFLAGLADDLASLLAEAFGVFTVAGEGFLDSFFFPAYVGAFVFPIPAVACDIEQILVEVDIIAANNFACVIDDVIGQTRSCVRFLWRKSCRAVRLRV